MVFLLSFTIGVQAVDVTKETIRKNLESYAMTGKVASAVVGNSRYTVGGDAAGIASLAITDDTLSFISSNTPLIFQYKIEGNVCTFIVESDITDQTDTNDYLTETLNINLLSACFLSVTDSFDVDSNDALYYYEERAEQTKLNINYEGIDNRDYIGIAKRYVENVGMVDDAVFHQYTKVITNSDTNCKYQTILEIKLDQVSNIKVERPVVEYPTTNTNTTAEQNTLVPVNNTTSNEIANEVVNETSNEITDELIGEVTNQIEQETAQEENANQETTEGNTGSTIFKVITILVIVALVVFAIVLFEKRQK